RILVPSFPASFALTILMSLRTKRPGKLSVEFRFKLDDTELTTFGGDVVMHQAGADLIDTPPALVTVTKPGALILDVRDAPTSEWQNLLTAPLSTYSDQTNFAPIDE